MCDSIAVAVKVLTPGGRETSTRPAMEHVIVSGPRSGAPYRYPGAVAEYSQDSGAPGRAYQTRQEFAGTMG